MISHGGVRLSLVITMIIATAASAAEAPKIKGEASLDKLISYARRNNPLIKSMIEEIDARKSRVDAGYGDWWPNLSASFSHSQVNPITNNETIDETWWTVSARQRILDFGQTSAAIGALKSEERMAELKLARARQILDVEVARRYFDYLLALEAVDVYMQTNAIAYVHWDRDNQKHEVGLVSQRVVSEKELIYRKEKLNLTRAQSEANLKLNILQKVIGAAVGDYFEVAPPPEGPPEIGLPELAAMEKEALENRAEMSVYEERLNVLRARYDKTRAAYFPTVEGVAEVGDSSRELLSKNRWRLGFQASVTLFDGFARNAELEEIAARIRSVEFDRENMARSILLEVREAYMELRLSEPKTLLANARMKNAQDELDYARSEYELNLVTELGDAFAEYAEAKLQMMKTHYDLRLELMKLALAAGKTAYPESASGQKEE